ncbi:MAG: hypothetical protein HQ518_01155 [Rhodopirellula sp.]|nr:hypothetical protein [Rhodopirellula sp.]
MSHPDEKKDPPVSSQQIEKHFGPVCEWHVADHVDAIDEPANCAAELAQKGHHARHTMIDGLSVVARRHDVPIL